MSNSIWHNRDETPKDFCDVVLSDSRTGSYCVFLSPFHDLSFNYDRWCYFDELLAQVDKAERLQKAVDYALHVLDNVSEIGGIDLEIAKIKQLIKENQ